MPVPTTSKTVAKPLSNQTIITIIIVIINFHHSFHIYLLTSYGKEELTFLVYLSMHVYHLSIYHLLIYLSIHHLSNYLSLSIYSIALVAQLCPTLCDPVGYSLARLLCPWDFQGKNTGVHCCSLLWGIFLTQGSNQGLLHCRQILYCLSHWGSPIYQFTHLITYLSIHLSNHLSVYIYYYPPI